MKLALRAVKYPPTRDINPLGEFKYLVEVIVPAGITPEPETALFLIGEDDRGFPMYGDVVDREAAMRAALFLNLQLAKTETTPIP